MPARPTTHNLPGLEDGPGDGRLVAPSANRNAEPIAGALGPLLAGLTGTVLEIGSGTGQHVAHFAPLFPELVWQPSDAVEENLASIQAWVDHAGCPNLRDPVFLDATVNWPVAGPLAAVIATNVIHIAPWPVAKSIVAGAGERVAPGGRLIFYGPFRENGSHTAESNAEFDRSLRARDPDWGVRDLEEVARLAIAAGFGPPEVTAMPANNRIVAFARA